MTEELKAIQSKLAQAKEISASPAELAQKLGPLAVETAHLLLTLARKREPRSEKLARRTLSALLTSEKNQLFSGALTDRIHRSSNPRTTVRVLKEIAARSACSEELPAFDRVQLRAARMFGGVVPGVTTAAVLNRVKDEAAPFLWSADEPLLTQHLEERRAPLVTVNLNYLGEEVLGEQDAQERLDAYIELAQRDDIDALSIKLSGIDCRMDALAFEATSERLFQRIRQIIEAAHLRPSGPPLVYMDMENYRDLQISEAILHRLLEADFLKNLQLGVAVQTYLPEACPMIERLAESSTQAVQRGCRPLRIRLVKGANLQLEEVEASTHRWTCPILESKTAVDENFKRTLALLLKHAAQGNLSAGIGSHNLFDISYALLLRAQTSSEKHVDFEMLEGMAGSLGDAVRDVAGGLLIYAPAVLDEHFSSAVSYLVRRLDENTAPENFLRDAPGMEPGSQSFQEHSQRFLSSLQASLKEAPPSRRTQNRAQEEQGCLPFEPEQPFDNSADTDWTREENRVWLRQHLDAAPSEVAVCPIVRHQKDGARKVIDGFDPSRPSYNYPIELASSSDIEEAIACGANYQRTWEQTSVQERTGLLRKVAALFEQHRGALIAAMVLDSGKRPLEADIEVSEAVDFANYYAICAEREPLGEARGLTVITPPWNFPFAIPLGGALAALVAGSTVLLKPAPETPWIAQKGVELCHEAGIPIEALQFLPCDDEDASPLIKDPRVASVVLTGATSTAAMFLKMRPSLHLMAETGGKNGAYLSSVCDREQSLKDIVHSAFGHAGQKCSALSLLIVHREVFEDPGFKRQLLDAAQSLIVGSAWDPETYVTPTILPAQGALAEIVEQGEQYAPWLLKPEYAEDNPRLLSPGILWGVEAGSFPHLTEFFGPILSVMVADNFDHAMNLLNASSYGLTAGLFSLSEGEQERFVKEADAGNLYINRPITGAVVGRQPFGGRKASAFGPGSKAGGPDYVSQMTKAVAEKAVARPRPIDEVFAERQDSFSQVMQENFCLVQDGTKVTGEQNYYRYVRGRSAIVLMPDADELSIRTALLARRLARSRLPVFIPSGPSQKKFQALLHRERAYALVFSSLDIPAKAEEMGAEKLRIVGTPDQALLRCAADIPLTVLHDPVSSDGRVEMPLHLLAQSISFSAHRHGNARLAQLSHLKRALQVWGYRSPRRMP